MLEERRGSHVSIRVPQRGDKRALMETVARNASEILIKHKTTRAGDLSTRNRALEEIQDALELPTAPLRIECYDISNLQGTEVVGSMVVFEDGLPRKSEYRRFVIRQVEGQNDVAAMHEVITRRFRRLIDDRAAMTKRTADGQPDGTGVDEGPLLVDPTTGAPRKFAYTPSLVVVDGGPRSGGRGRKGSPRARHRRHSLLWPCQAVRGSVAARRRRTSDLAADQRGSLPAAAAAGRGAPFRDHPSPGAAQQVDGRIAPGSGAGSRRRPT